MKRKKINFWKTITYIIYGLVIIFAFLAISAKFSIGGIKLLVVKSGSMEPTIRTGSLVVDRTAKEYKESDIITFRSTNDPSNTTTHRIVGIEKQDNSVEFITKGDANDSNDPLKLNPDLIIGKVVFKIPYLGYIVAFARTMPGLIILVIIPATIIIYDEINNIKKEIILRRKKGRKKIE